MLRLEFAKSTETRLKSSTTKFYGHMRQRFILTKVMEKLMCEEGKHLLMIPNTQANLWNKVDIISWLGLAWLLV